MLSAEVKSMHMHAMVQHSIVLERPLAQWATTPFTRAQLTCRVITVTSLAWFGLVKMTMGRGNNEKIEGGRFRSNLNRRCHLASSI